jgi:conjugal transfer pilus assembly protein TraV
MMVRAIAAAIGVSGLFGLSGCSLNTAGSDEFTCANKINGVCGSPVQVYKMTNGALPEAAPAKPVLGGNNMGAEDDDSQSAGADSKKSVAQEQFSVFKKDRMLQPVTGAPMPLREPARVMRIWVAPWVESKTEALHWPSFVYVEVEARKWSMGLKDFKGLKTGIPLVHRTNPANLPPFNEPGGESSDPSKDGSGVSRGGANGGSVFPTFE